MRRVESPSGGSTLITSAPMSHSCIAQNGPAITCVTSRTRHALQSDRSALAPVLVTREPLTCPPRRAPFDVDGQIAFLTFTRPEAQERDDVGHV